jgi:hypothetical protein
MAQGRNPKNLNVAAVALMGRILSVRSLAISRIAMLAADMAVEN